MQAHNLELSSKISQKNRLGKLYTQNGDATKLTTYFPNHKLNNEKITDFKPESSGDLRQIAKNITLFGDPGEAINILEHDIHAMISPAINPSLQNINLTSELIDNHLATLLNQNSQSSQSNMATIHQLLKSTLKLAAAKVEHAQIKAAAAYLAVVEKYADSCKLAKTAQIMLLKAKLLATQANHQQSIQSLTTALAEYQKKDSALYKIAQVQIEIASEFININNYDEATTYLIEVSELLKNIQIPVDHPFYLKYLYLSLKLDLKTGQKILNLEAMEQIKVIDPKSTTLAAIQIYLDFAELWLNFKDHDQAYIFIQTSLLSLDKFSAKNKSSNLAKCHLKLAQLYKRLDRTPSAFTFARLALKFYESSNEQLNLAKCYYLLGDILSKLSHYELANQSYTNCLNTYIKSDHYTLEDLANLAKKLVLLNESKYSSKIATADVEKVRDIIKVSNLPDKDLCLAEVSILLVECYLDAKKTEDAVAALKTAGESLNEVKVNATNYLAVAMQYCLQADGYLQFDDTYFDHVTEAFSKAEQILINNNSSSSNCDKETLAEVFFKIAEYYSYPHAQQNIKKAKGYLIIISEDEAISKKHKDKAADLNKSMDENNYPED